MKAIARAPLGMSWAYSLKHSVTAVSMFKPTLIKISLKSSMVFQSYVASAIEFRISMRGPTDSAYSILIFSTTPFIPSRATDPFNILKPTDLAGLTSDLGSISTEIEESQKETEAEGLVFTTSFELARWFDINNKEQKY